MDRITISVDLDREDYKKQASQIIQFTKTYMCGCFIIEIVATLILIALFHQDVLEIFLFFKVGNVSFFDLFCDIILALLIIAEFFKAKKYFWLCRKIQDFFLSRDRSTATIIFTEHQLQIYSKEEKEYTTNLFYSDTIYPFLLIWPKDVGVGFIFLLPLKTPVKFLFPKEWFTSEELLQLEIWLKKYKKIRFLH